MPKKPKYVPPSGWLFCKGENSTCGGVHYDGSKGGPKPTDELVCDGEAACDDDACECKLCYTIKFRGHDETYVLFPGDPKPIRSQVEQIEKDDKKRRRIWDW
jgi:hypothetical protein